MYSLIFGLVVCLSVRWFDLYWHNQYPKWVFRNVYHHHVFHCSLNMLHDGMIYHLCVCVFHCRLVVVSANSLSSAPQVFKSKKHQFFPLHKEYPNHFVCFSSMSFFSSFYFGESFESVYCFKSKSSDVLSFVYDKYCSKLKWSTFWRTKINKWGFSYRRRQTATRISNVLTFGKKIQWHNIAHTNRRTFWDCMGACVSIWRWWRLCVHCSPFYIFLKFTKNVQKVIGKMKHRCTNGK